MNLEVFFIDSFTNKVFGGNPAGVIFHSDPIDETVMQAIAAENNLSETAFINTQNDNQIRFLPQSWKLIYVVMQHWLLPLSSLTILINPMIKLFSHLREVN